MKAKMRNDWLDRVREAPIDPDYPVIDPHNHMWLDHPRRDFSYSVDELGADATAGHNVLATVFVNCTTQYRASGPEHLKPVGETEWVNACAEDYARRHPGGPALCAGIVGHVNCTQDTALIDEALLAHKVASKRFRGIRHSAAYSDDPVITPGRALYPPHLYADPVFHKGVKRLAHHGLSFDAWLYHDQLPELIALARAASETPIVLDHFGAPLGQGRWAGKQKEVLAAWTQSIGELARCPNVHMKLGGTVMPMFGYDWEARPNSPSSDELVKAAGHFFDVAIEAFGPSRCMFESNFPVDRLACSYVVLWNSFKKMAARYSASERADLFWGTARRFYKLDAVKVPA
jgi:L-fuconolactonase